MLSNIYFFHFVANLLRKILKTFQIRCESFYITLTKFYDLLSSLFPASKILWTCFDMLSFEHNLLLPNNANLLRQVCI